LKVSPLDIIPNVSTTSSKGVTFNNVDGYIPRASGRIWRLGGSSVNGEDTYIDATTLTTTGGATQSTSNVFGNVIFWNNSKMTCASEGITLGVILLGCNTELINPTFGLIEMDSSIVLLDGPSDSLGVPWYWWMDLARDPIESKILRIESVLVVLLTTRVF